MTTTTITTSTTTTKTTTPSYYQTTLQVSRSLLQPSLPYDVSSHTPITENDVVSKDVIVMNQWLVLSKIGEGSFGEVFKVQDINNGRLYALKREPLDMNHPQLRHESYMYNILTGGSGIPRCHWYGQYDDFDCIIVDLLGPNLKELRQSVSVMPLDVTVHLGCQLVSIMEHIHGRGLVYRDVKPENFLLAVEDGLSIPHFSSAENNFPCRSFFRQWRRRMPKIYAVDFGLATWWRNPKTSKPHPEAKRPIRNKTGTARYASLNVHHGERPTRRDDLESLGYLVLELVLDGLPWTGIQARTCRSGWEKMRAVKESTMIKDLCTGLPRGFLEFIEYVRRLGFFDRPDYDYLRRLLQGSLDGGEFSQRVNPSLTGSVFKPAPSAYAFQKHPLSSLHRPSAKINAGRDREDTRETRPRRSSFKDNTMRYRKASLPEENREGVFMMNELSHALQCLDPTKKEDLHAHRRRRNNSYKQSRTEEEGPPTRRSYIHSDRVVMSTSSSHQKQPWRPYRNTSADVWAVGKQTCIVSTAKNTAHRL
ncbi:kinase-like domain-containing protein [Radiomyces spectabilis]|uniref:kinase-like domain-containing protein n=1 Tax=Radiomyces spectabilis TaxID=64574 RepID=UPI002221089A|nr:kinase-like domain-containing protein [Radiomyces spectabilis]KAI8377928.1 kinase-like domain-containing protein [Radiomyces spectabilis]